MDHPRERAAAIRLLPSLLPANAGHWGIFHGDGLFAICKTFDEAMAQAYAAYRPEEFLLVEIVGGEEESP